MTSKDDWLHFTDSEIATQIKDRVSLVVLLINGTRRWFLAQQTDWSYYPQAAGVAHRRISQLFYDHGISVLVQPFFGTDLLVRGEEYLEMTVPQALTTLADESYMEWYHTARIHVSFYGNWRDPLRFLGYQEVVAKLDAVMRATENYREHYLLVGLFADYPLSDIVSLAKSCHNGQELIERYYGLPMPPIDLIIGSGQPAIWDIPLLDFNQASLYFLEAPTFYMTRETVRHILYDHLFERTPDDNITSLSSQSWDWTPHKILGIGKRTPFGWVTL